MDTATHDQKKKVSTKASNGRSSIRTRVNIGISEENLKQIVVILNRCLANESLLTIKVKKLHWDIVGPQFISLHKLWDEHYTQMTEYVDEIAERVRSRGGFPIGTASGFLEHATVAEHPGVVSSATEAVNALLQDHELIVRTLRNAIDKCDDLGDAGTADFLTGMLESHEQMAWMHRSFLEGEAIRSNDKLPADENVPEFA